MGLLTAGASALGGLLGGQPETATLTITGGPGGSVSFVVNPDSVVLNKTSSYKKAASTQQTGAQQGTGNATKYHQAQAKQWSGAQPATLKINGLLDKTTTSSSHVMDDINTLWGCLLLPDTSGGAAPTPPILYLSWGSWTWFDSVLTGFQATFTQFRSDGTPTRAQVQLTLTENVAAQSGQNPTSGAFGSRETHTVVAGDSLASVSYKAYGRADYWRALAEVNGIDDPFRVRPGTSLLVPPADVARSMR